MKRFEGKAAIVTGGSSGIGAAIAARLVEDGAQVLSIDLAAPAASRPGIVDHQADVTSAATVDAAIAAAVQRFGRLDFLVNNAGIGALAETPVMEDALWDKVLAVNLSSIFYTCRAAIPVMRGRGGAIVNVASISGLAGDYGMGIYNASKAAAINYTRSLAIDCAADGIRVNALCPGPVTNTAIGVGVHGSAADRQAWIDYVPMQRHGQPEEMAGVVAFLLSDDASYMTGSIVVADGGVSAHTGQPNVVAQRKRRVADAAAAQAT